MTKRQTRQAFWGPMGKMGQPRQNPVGPDGWPDEDQNWTSLQGLAARIDWAMNVPKLLKPALPDPRALADRALGTRATLRVHFSADAVDTKPDGTGLVLASPLFQKM